MNCRHAVGLITEYVDGRLKGVRARELEEHLDSCASCRSALEALKAVAQTVRSLPSPAPPRDFTARVIDRLRAEPTAKGIYARWLAPALGAAVLALVLAGVLEFAQRSGRPPALRPAAVPQHAVQTVKKPVAGQIAVPGQPPKAVGAPIPEIEKPAAKAGDKTAALPAQELDRVALPRGMAAPPQVGVEPARPAKPSRRFAFAPPGAAPAPGPGRESQPTPGPPAPTFDAAQTKDKLNRGVRPEAFAAPSYTTAPAYPSAPGGPPGATAPPSGATPGAQAPSMEEREAPKPEKRTSVLRLREPLPIILPTAKPFRLLLTRSQSPPYLAVRLKALRRAEKISITLIQEPRQSPARGQVAPTQGGAAQLVPGQVSQVSLSAGEEQTMGLASLASRPTGGIEQISISSPDMLESRFLLIRPLPSSAIRQGLGGLEQPAQALLRLCSLAGVTLLVEPPLPYASYGAPTAPPKASLLFLLRQMGYHVEQEGNLWTAQRPA